MINPPPPPILYPLFNSLLLFYIEGRTYQRARTGAESKLQADHKIITASCIRYVACKALQNVVPRTTYHAQADEIALQDNVYV